MAGSFLPVLKQHGRLNSNVNCDPTWSCFVVKCFLESAQAPYTWAPRQEVRDPGVWGGYKQGEAPFDKVVKYLVHDGCKFGSRLKGERLIALHLQA